MKNRIVSFALIMCLIFLSIPLSSSAIENTISLDDARLLARFHVYDCIEFDKSITWTYGTEIDSEVNLYDENDNLTAYSFELVSREKTPNGYIIVSADAGLKNLIMEYSDKAAPIYEEFALEEDSKILYTGVLNYFHESEGITENTDLVEVEKEEIVNEFVELKSAGNVRENQAHILSIEEAKEEVKFNAPLIVPFAGENLYPITDPISYMLWAYGSTNAVSIDWQNDYENYCYFYTQSGLGYPLIPNACAPTAIVNIMKMVADRRYYSGIYDLSAVRNLSGSSLFLYIASRGSEWGYYQPFPGSPTGSFIATQTAYFAASYREYTTIQSTGTYAVTYDHIRHELDVGNPFIISIDRYNPVYPVHAVACYAFTRFQNSGGIKTFAKVADGIDAQGRYIDLAHINNSRCKMHVARIYS